MNYFRPASLSDALDVLQKHQVAILAGGTDFFPSKGEQPIEVDILDVTKITEFNDIIEHDTGYRIGANVTWSQLQKADLPPVFDGLKLAGREVGSVQIQNTGTLVGNICNASPVADGVPALLTLQTKVEISSPAGMRLVDLGAFIQDIRKIDLNTNEIVSALHVPKCAPDTKSSFLKLGSRKYLVISIAMIAVVIHVEEDVIVDVKIAVGACSKVAQRLTGLESELIGQNISVLLQDDVVRPEHLSNLTPIDDVRGTGAYRLDAVVELCRRTLLDALEVNHVSP